jgi:hypothetical protein
MTARRLQTLARAAVAGMIAACAFVLLAATAPPTAAQVAAATKTYANEHYRYTVALPDGCRHEEGPGTLDAVCAKTLDPQQSARADSAAALVMEVAAEIVPGNSGTPIGDLAKRYDAKAFRDELPQAVCGETDATRARINNVQQTLEEARVVYTADVICSEVRFLQIAERRASVRYLIGPEARHRLVARAPIEEFEKHKQAIDAFFESFRVLPIGKQNQ